MRMFAEEDVVNTFLNRAQKQFELKNYQITVVPGNSLINNPQKDQYQQALTDSLTQLNKQYHQTIDQTQHQKLNPDHFYILIYQRQKVNNMLRLIFPYGSNLAPILLGALVKRNKDNQETTAKNLRKLVQQTVDDIVLHEIFKYYQPQKGTREQFSKKITDSIRYQMLKEDSFNLVIRFTLPLKETTQKFQKAIKKDHNDKDKPLSKTNYNQIALSNLLSLNYDPTKENVTFITSLY